MNKCKRHFIATLIGLGIACALPAVAFSGCGGGEQRAAIAGKVTVDGAPLEEGVITFIPADGQTGLGSGGKIAGGVYSIDAAQGPAAGKFRVEILATRKTGKKMEAGPPAKPGTMIEETVQFLPPKFNRDSTLAAEIKLGKNILDFQLSTKP